ncbi:leucine-rich repeat domain-containing protein, partial [Marinigracilibium pacificum]
MKNVLILFVILLTIACGSETKKYKLLSSEELNDAELYFGIEDLKNAKDMDSVYVFLVKEEDLKSDSYLRDEIFKYRNIQDLSFRRLSLKEIKYSDLKKFPNLQNLDYANNNLIEITSEIKSLKNLKELNLEYNDISELPDELHQLTKLEKLYIGYNPISSEELLK